VDWHNRIDAESYVDPRAHRIAAPLTDLCAAPDGARDRQLLFGARFDVIDQCEGWAFGMADDGYCGWLDLGALAEWHPPTHWLAAPASHLYPAPDIKASPVGALSLCAAVVVTAAQGAWVREIAGNWLPAAHLRPWGDRAADPVAVAESLLGTPYLWGGNSRAGLDCSGLVQIACRACGLACPADSDMQASRLGDPLAPEAPLRRGDLVFWKGHVGWMANETSLLHANAHHMAVAHEPLAVARARIIATGGGPVTQLRRIAHRGA
jgi:cell wall-associated NlpC family hydrolase